jgi:hypothetical protein
MADGTVKTATSLFKSWKGLNETTKHAQTQKKIIAPYNKISGRHLDCKTTPWCQIAVVSCLYQAGLKKYYITAGCKQAMNWYKNKKRWKGKSTKPAVGYQVFYDFKGKGNPTHTGLVVAVSGNTVTVYEGNKSNAVGVRKYNYKTYTKYIVGYGQPYYLAAKAETPATTTPDTSTSEPIVTEPIIPIPEPAKPVSKPATKPASKSYRGQVTAKKGLNVRKGPGTNYTKVGALGYGTRVTVFESKHGWGRIGSGKWVSLSYIKKV